MKKILLICVNYNSYCALQDFMESVNSAAQAVVKKLQVDVAITDNTEIGRQKIKTSYEFVNNVSLYIPDTNLGYLGGALLVYNQMCTQYDWVVISNVDLRLQTDFFEQLVSIECPADVAWIAPDIYTSSTKQHENPYMLQRPAKRNFCIWFLIYSCLLIYYVYYFLHRLKSARKMVASKTNSTIYAGHGAFMLFTRNFIEHYPSLTYPASLR